MQLPYRKAELILASPHSLLIVHLRPSQGQHRELAFQVFAGQRTLHAANVKYVVKPSGSWGQRRKRAPSLVTHCALARCRHLCLAQCRAVVTLPCCCIFFRCCRKMSSFPSCSGQTRLRKVEASCRQASLPAKLSGPP